MNTSSGAALGALVKHKRTLLGLTQDQVALAIGLSDKSRISNLENGHVSDPRPATIRLLANFLEITDQDLIEHGVTPAPALPKDTGLPDGLLKRLALFFGSVAPDASELDLYHFLLDKAEAFRDMEARLDALAAAQGRIANLVGEAKGLIGDGRFEEADDLLADAEEMQLKDHVAEPAKQLALIRWERASSALLMNDLNQAMEQFTGAIQLLRGIDNTEAAVFAEQGASYLLEYSRRYGGRALDDAIGLFDEALDLRKNDEDRFMWALVKETKSAALKEKVIQGQRTRAPGTMREAIDGYGEALEALDRDAHPHEWASIVMSRANAYQTQATLTSVHNRAELLDAAVADLDSVLRFWTRDSAPMDWARAQMNRSIIRVDQAGLASRSDRAAILQEAIAGYDKALEVRTQDSFPREWALTQFNKAVAFERLARTPEEDRMGRLAEAVSCYDLALGVFSSGEYPRYHEICLENITDLRHEIARYRMRDLLS